MGHGARLLSVDLAHTYLEGSFGGGAIDHLLVAGPRAADFHFAVTPDVQGTSYRGSDHRPVIASVSAQ